MTDKTNEKVNALEKAVNWMLDKSTPNIVSYVEKLREQNNELSNNALAKKIVNRKSFKNGLVGGITGLGGLIALPVAVPADLLASWKIQISMTIAIAHIYGHTVDTTDLKTDIFIVLAGDSAKETLKRFGIEASKSITKKVIEKYITRDVMVKIWKVVGQKIITKAGQKSLTSFMKMVPLVGAPVGFAFDWSASKVVGRNAIKYYSGEK